MLLNCLLSAFPEKGLELYNTLDYWTCKDLLTLSNNARISQEEYLQTLENNIFNEYLDINSNKKITWLNIEDKKNLWQIKEFSKHVLDNK